MEEGSEMAAVYLRSMFLFDPTMQTLAELMLMEDATNPNGGWVKVIPTYACYETYKADPQNIVVNTLMPGMHMSQEAFLSYLGNSAYYGSKTPYPPIISSMTQENGDVRLILTTGLSIETVTKLTGWDKEFIGEFFKDYLVFG